MVKLILFDLDGTLLNTSGDIHSVLNASLKKFGAPEVSLSDTLKFVGNGAKLLVERALGVNGADKFQDVYADYSVNFSSCDNNLTCLYDGEDEALTRFSQAGIALAVITNKPQRAAERVCEKYLGKYGLYKVIGQSPEHALKPDPQTALSVLSELNVKKDECVLVGDGETDVETAKNAGVRCVSALWGFRTKTELENAGATLFANNFKELENVVFLL